MPNSFNCNDSGSFVITLRPDVDTSYTGPSDLVFNRLYFILKSGYDSVITNYVEFLAEDTLDKQLEWGGSLPTGDYRVRGIMKNAQLNSSCQDSLHRVVYKNLGWIDITEFAYPQKVMQIEYFCQDSDIGAIDRYDVFLSPNTAEYMDIAFNIANTGYNVTTYDTNLTPQLIEYNPDNDFRKIKDYIFNLKEWEWEMFLCGIKGLKDAQGYVIPDLFGVTYEDDTLGFVPTCTTGTLVAVKTCIDFAASDQYKLDYNDLVTATTIHELGHQRAIWQHHDLETPKFCIMKRVFIVYAYYEGEHPYWAVTYSNPHFCNQCIDKMKNIDW